MELVCKIGLNYCVISVRTFGNSACLGTYGCIPVEGRIRLKNGIRHIADRGASFHLSESELHSDIAFERYCNSSGRVQRNRGEKCSTLQPNISGSRAPQDLTSENKQLSSRLVWDGLSFVSFLDRPGDLSMEKHPKNTFI